MNDRDADDDRRFRPEGSGDPIDDDVARAAAAVDAEAAAADAIGHHDMDVARYDSAEVAPDDDGYHDADVALYDEVSRYVAALDAAALDAAALDAAAPPPTTPAHAPRPTTPSTRPPTTPATPRPTTPGTRPTTPGTRPTTPAPTTSPCSASSPPPSTSATTSPPGCGSSIPTTVDPGDRAPAERVLADAGCVPPARCCWPSESPWWCWGWRPCSSSTGAAATIPSPTPGSR